LRESISGFKLIMTGWPLSRFARITVSRPIGSTTVGSGAMSVNAHLLVGATIIQGRQRHLQIVARSRRRRGAAEFTLTILNSLFSASAP